MRPEISAEFIFGLSVLCLRPSSTEVGPEYMMLIAHNLMDFHLQDFFSNIRIKRGDLVLCLD